MNSRPNLIIYHLQTGPKISSGEVVLLQKLNLLLKNSEMQQI
jgi:hypothetical protein